MLVAMKACRQQSIGKLSTQLIGAFTEVHITACVAALRRVGVAVGQQLLTGVVGLTGGRLFVVDALCENQRVQRHAAERAD